MITVLRGMLKSHVYRIFLWIFLAVLVLGGLLLDYSDNKPWVIKVYEQKFTELEFRQAVNTSQRQYDYLKAQGISWPRTEKIEKEVLRNMIRSALLINVGKQMHLEVPVMLLQEQLSGQLASLPTYFFDANGALNEEMFNKLIAPKTFESFVQEIENELRSNFVYSLIALGSYVPEYEVVTQYTEEYADKSYSILTIPFQKALDVAKAEKVSDDTLERFYKKSEHGDLYKTQEKRAGYAYTFKAHDYGLSVSKVDVTQYYEKNKQEYLKEAAKVQVHRIYFAVTDDLTVDPREQAQVLHEQLTKEPETFAAVAKKITQAKLASQGAEKTEFFAKDSTAFDKIFVDTAFEQLSQDGDISPVIKTDKGYEILQRLGRTAAKYTPLHDVQDAIEEKLLQEKFAKRFQQDADRVVSHAQYNKEGLTSFIEKRKGHKEVIALDSKKPGIMHMHLFQTEEGKYVVFMNGKEGVILTCTQINKKALQPFAEIKSTVAADYYKKQAQQELQIMVQHALQDLATMDFAACAKKYHGTTETAHATYKDGQMDQSAILRRPEVMSKIKTLQSAGSIIDVISSTEGLVIRLDDVAPINEHLFVEKSSLIKATLASKAKYKGTDSFIASLDRHAKLNNKIEVKDQIIKDVLL